MQTLSDITTALDILKAEGYETPGAIAEILAARTAALDPAPTRATARNRLWNAIAAGDVAEAADASAAYDAVPELPYYANSGPAVENATIAALLGVVDPTECFGFLSARFTATGRELASAIKKQDPDLPAEAVALLSSTPCRDAWAKVPSLTAGLARLADAMVAILRDLADVHVVARTGNRPDDLLPLCVRYDEDLGPALREVWIREPRPARMNQPAQEAHPGRAGLWGDILAAGGVIEAPTTPGDFSRWPSPRATVVGEPSYSGGPSVPRAPSTPTEIAFYADAAAAREASLVTDSGEAPATPATGSPGVGNRALRSAAGLSE